MSRRQDTSHSTHLPIKAVLQRYAISHDHLLHLVEDGTIEAVDFRRAGAAQPYWLVRLSSLHRFLRDRSNQRPRQEDQTIGHRPGRASTLQA